MATITISAYQLPYTYKDIDRFYQTKDGVVSLPTPVFSKTIDTTRPNVEKISFKPITFKTAELNTQGQINYNYIKVSGVKHNNLNDSYWFITDSEIIVSGDSYKHTLQYDIINSLPLFKDSSTKDKISLERRLYSGLKTSNNKLVLKEERNPHLWNNNEFKTIIPNKKKVKGFSLSPLLEATTNTFRNGNKVYRVPEKFKDTTLTFRATWPVKVGNPSSNCWVMYDTGSDKPISKDYTIKLSPFISLLNEIVKMTNYRDKGGEISQAATLSTPYVNDELKTYNATTIIPVLYDKLVSPYVANGKVGSGESFVFIEKYQEQEITDNINHYDTILKREISASGSFTDPWNNTISFTNEGLVVLLNRVLTGFEKNQIDRVRANTQLVNINAITHWLLDIPEPNSSNEIKVDSFLPYKERINGTNPTDTCYLANGGEFYPNPYKIPLRLDRKVLKTKIEYDLSHKVEIDIDNTLFTDWDKYKYSQPQLFSNVYNPLYIDLVGKEIPLEKQLALQTGKVSLETWLGSGEQNISLYQGKYGSNNEILQPQWVQKHAFSLPIEFSKDISSTTLQLKSNYYQAKLNETALAARRDDNQISALRDSKIQANNDAYDIVDRANVAEFNTQNTGFRGFVNNFGSSVGSAVGGAFTGSLVGGGAGAVAGPAGAIAGAVVGAGVGIGRAATGVSTRSSLFDIQQNRDFNRNEAANRALTREAKAAGERAQADAAIKRSIIEGEMKDISNLPDKTQNTSNITKLVSMEKGQVSLIERQLNEKQEKAMWEFWNENGTTSWGNMSFTPNWYKQYTFFDYFKGGDWTQYLNSIGIYNIEIIQEFNQLMATGIRLRHQEYQKGAMSDKRDIATIVPNWERTLVSSIL